MFNRKKRAVVLTFQKKDEDAVPHEPITVEEVEQKAEVILHKLESLGAKMFVGAVIYILLDTRRQVAVARANQPQDQC